MMRIKSYMKASYNKHYLYNIIEQYIMMILKHHNWLVVSTPLKNMKVSWDDDIPSMMGKSFKIPWFTTN